MRGTRIKLGNRIAHRPNPNPLTPRLVLSWRCRTTPASEELVPFASARRCPIRAPLFVKLAFAGFLAAVTACMAPVVLVSWRHTPTAIVLTRAAITSLHGERVLKTLPWTEVASVTRRETQGNVRWIVAAREGERIALDGELEDLPGLIAAIERLANVT